MSTDATVNFEDDDWEDRDSDEGYDTSFDPDSFPDVTAAKTSAQQEKDISSKTRLLQAEANKNASDLKRQLRKDLKRNNQDESRARRIQSKADKAEAKARRSEINAQAVSQRIQAYSVSSVLGFKGYVAASILDQFYIRPQADAQIEAEKKYASDYTAYEQSQEKGQIERRREQEDQIDAITAAKIDPKAVQGHYEGPVDQRSPLPSTAPVSSAVSSVAPISSSISSVASTVAQTAKTVAPVASAEILAAAGPAALAIAAAMEVTKVITGSIDSASEGTQKLAKAAFAGDSTEGLRTVGHTAIGAQTFGIGPVVGPIVSAIETGVFDNILTAVDSIKSYVEKDISFSPEAMVAKVEGQVQRLIQSIEMGTENDALKAEFLRTTTRLDLIWQEFQQEMFQSFGPLVITLLRDLIAVVSVLKPIASWVPTILDRIADNSIFFGAIREILSIIADNTEPDKNPNVNDEVLKKIQNFLNPNNGTGLNMKRLVPNP